MLSTRRIIIRIVLLLFCCCLTVVAVVIHAGIDKEVTIQLFEHDDNKLDEKLIVGDEQSPFAVDMRSSTGLSFKCDLNSDAPSSKSIEGGACLLSPQNHENYWRYEVCLGSNVSQVHMENGRVLSRISLGSIVSLNHSTQIYEGGSGGRVALVSFFCDSAAEKPYISRCEENAPLQYKIHVGTVTSCRKGSPTLDSVPCLDRIVQGWRLRVCPGKSVLQKREDDKETLMNNNKDATIFSKFIQRNDAFHNRKVELFQAEEDCVDDPQVKKSVKVTYACMRTYRTPMILTIDQTKCLANIRIGLAQVCDTAFLDIHCKQQSSSTSLLAS